MQFKYIAFALSGIIITVGVFNITVNKSLDKGIDFAGGTLIRVAFKDQVPISDVRFLLREADLGKCRIQEIGKSNREYMIRTLTLKSGELEQDLEAHEIIGNKVVDALRVKGELEVLSRETVGPQIGHDLTRKATQATIWALIGMLTYIGIRFKFAYGIAAILTLSHDVLITTGIFSLTNREINLPVVAAILTIVGYSLNDTIVIFDRVRDNLKIYRKDKFEDVLDKSINQTLSRTVVTSGTTFLTVTALFLFGGEVINDFAFTMMIGVIIGTYSSIYQSCPHLYFWNKIFKPKKGMGK